MAYCFFFSFLTNNVIIILAIIMVLHHLSDRDFLGSLVGKKKKKKKNLLAIQAIQETQVQSLSQEDSLEKELATHSSILTWKIPWTEEPGGLQSVESQESDDLVTKPPNRNGEMNTSQLSAINHSTL